MWWERNKNKNLNNKNAIRVGSSHPWYTELEITAKEIVMQYRYFKISLSKNDLRAIMIEHVKLLKNDEQASMCL